MFDITSSKLLILAIVALIVVGPKDLPVLLRTVGKYLGVIRRHANEFRAQFDEALREAELDQLRKDFDSVRNEMRSTIEHGSRAIETGIAKAGTDAEPPRKGEAGKGEDGATAPAAPAPQEPDAIVPVTEPAASAPAVDIERTASVAPPTSQSDPIEETQTNKTGT